MTFEFSTASKIAILFGLAVTIYIYMAGPTEVGIIPFVLGAIAIGVVLADFLHRQR